MPRIRTIKPEFFQDEKLSPLAPIDRLVFLGLISMADDAGRLLDNVKVIDAFIFPETDDTSRDSLDTLARLARIVRYVAPSGQKLIQIRNWSDHQKVDHAARHVLPAPSEDDMAQVVATTEVATASTDDARNPRESVAKDSRLDLGPTTTDLRPEPSPRGKRAASRARGAGGHDTWLTPAQGAWEQHFGAGSFRAKKAAGQLAPLKDAGLSPEEIGHRLGRYCAARKGGFCNLADFAEHHAEWADAGGPLLDEHGWMSPELERETRPRDAA